MDNLDGTLSIFGTVLDAASDSQSPAPGSAQAFNEEMLASIGREFAYNDPQAGLGSGDGTASDQNVELLVDDPRTANLELVKSDSPDPVPLGRDLTYTLLVANHGPSAASATVTDTLPASVDFVSASATQGSCLHLAGSVTCDLGSIPDGATATVTIRVVPNTIGTIVNQATVTSPLNDDNLGDNSDTEQTTVAPGETYPRPLSARKVSVSLVPAYEECTAPNRVHGPPLDEPSCAPPDPSSGSILMRTSAIGSALFKVQEGDPFTTADEADVTARFDMTDVRRQGTLADYVGEVEVTSVIRITDRLNGTGITGGTTPGTVADFPFPVLAACTATSSGAIGAHCSVDTSFDAVVPNSIREGKRAIWEVGQMMVKDGGSDGQMETLPNTLFAVQGLFVP
jgi:uncharacterized repeat protein (TIGR01451 family)